MFLLAASNASCCLHSAIILPIIIFSFIHFVTVKYKVHNSFSTMICRRGHKCCTTWHKRAIWLTRQLSKIYTRQQTCVFLLTICIYYSHIFRIYIGVLLFLGSNLILLKWYTGHFLFPKCGLLYSVLELFLRWTMVFTFCRYIRHWDTDGHKCCVWIFLVHANFLFGMVA